ncbi:uncharacterized protein K452DRAFT_223312 [Aplosporella prunicola CBS 121167]|uniref:Amino acid permease/ SLC12A domain-containing protein n=1 Tax=Aplosporella prunicola CBS 121167 TaxID=1176127 RepID=A0A6A6BJY2_9PEZI|nr:uncharacterized protein K452DRAFT_223312 [Aplosporella prunicola CBS 121167]KAF2144336.1 hypothetical protein K452DRAFT_223312 [Aplosporella prunicola CBS 121167]
MKKDIDIERELHLVPSNVVGQTEPLGGDSTQRGLKSRHAQMIALGGTIGTGLFVGVGQALQMGGPVFLLASYSLISILVYGIVTCTTEMSSYLPIPGCSMAYYGDRFFSPSLGFALGWMYWYVFAITVPAEITVGSLVIEYWNPPVNIAVWITILFVVIIALNCFPVGVYGEAEFWFASIKVFGIIGLIIMALVLVLGGGPTHDRLGFRYWIEPGPVNEYLVSGDTGRLSAFVGTVCFSVYAFAFAPELLVVTGGEMESPRQNLPIAGRRYFYRLITFYILGALAIGMIVPSNNPKLLGAGSSASASPWAIAAKSAGIKGLDSVINAVILLSAWSAGNSYLYLASRTLYSLALTGNAPATFARCTKSGVPYNALATSASLSLLSYLNLSSTGSTVFNWFVNLINTGGFQSWICVGIVYIRFRKAANVQKIVDIPFRSCFQPYMAYVTTFMFSLLLLLNGFKNFVGDQWDTSSFMTSYIGIPIFFALYFGHKFTVGRKDPWVLSPHEVDLFSGLQEILEKEASPKPRKSWKQTFTSVFE